MTENNKLALNTTADASGIVPSRPKSRQRKTKTQPVEVKVTPLAPTETALDKSAVYETSQSDALALGRIISNQRLAGAQAGFSQAQAESDKEFAALMGGFVTALTQPLSNLVDSLEGE